MRCCCCRYSCLAADCALILRTCGAGGGGGVELLLKPLTGYETCLMSKFAAVQGRWIASAGLSLTRTAQLSAGRQEGVEVARGGGGGRGARQGNRIPDISKVLLVEGDGLGGRGRGREGADGSLLDCRAAKKLCQAGIAHLAHPPPQQESIVQRV